MGPREGCDRLRLQITRHSAREGGKVVTLTHRPPLPPGISWYSYLEAESTPQFYYVNFDIIDNIKVPSKALVFGRQLLKVEARFQFQAGFVINQPSLRKAFRIVRLTPSTANTPNRHIHGERARSRRQLH